MNIEDIQKFLDNKTSPKQEHVMISFKKRNTICGLFVKGAEFSRLTLAKD